MCKKPYECSYIYNVPVCDGNVCDRCGKRVISIFIYSYFNTLHNSAIKLIIAIVQYHHTCRPLLLSILSKC